MSSRAPSDRARPAAARLKHDLGKYVRWSAPDQRESDPDELRARLRRDLMATRLVEGTARTALDVYDGWRLQDGAALEGIGSLAQVDQAVRRVGLLLPGLEELDAAGLAALDDAALDLAAACGAVFREVVRREEGS